MAIRLQKFEVKNLFGQYDNNIDLKLDERITAVIGPNGRGKTICLKLIHALYNRNYWAFTSIQYDDIKFTFDNGVELLVCKSQQANEYISDDEEAHALPLEFTLKNGEQIDHWFPRNNNQPFPVKFIRRYFPFLERIGPNRWLDQSNGQRFTTDAIFERYGDMLPPDLISSKFSDEPEGFVEILGGVKCHLIETQRLLNLSWDEPDHRYYDSRKRPETNLVVHQKAIKLRELIKSQLAEYAALSQRLDRSFPRRVIEGFNQNISLMGDIPIRLETQETKRKALENAGILDTEENQIALPDAMDPAISKLLSVYVQDTDEKLNVFTDLLSKIDLFQTIINKLFIDKNVVGFKIVPTSKETLPSDNDEELEIPLEKLSSGEQHQIILVFELLFEIRKNSLILIDEPELSLHVGWQKKFIEHLIEIIKLSDFDVILATHSPQLIGSWRHLMVELADVEN
jgi:predicted ATP-binding protein involved in virulence